MVSAIIGLISTVISVAVSVGTSAANYAKRKAAQDNRRIAYMYSQYH